MLSNYILKKGNYALENENREKIGFLTGSLGLFLNLSLSVLKIIVGIATGSISVLADATNNVSDSFSSIITIASAKLANMPPDEKHPYGHGRIEYLAALIVSCMIIFVGTQFIKSSYERIVNPKEIYFNLVSFIILLISIVTKIYMYRFYNKVGDAINSATLRAASTDSISDVLVTTVVTGSLIFGKIIPFPIDGYIGIAVSIFIIYAGIGLIKDTISSIIGEAPSKEFIDEIHSKMETYEGVVNVHDIIVNSFGPERKIVVLDAQMPYHMDIVKVHEIIDKAERELSEEMGIHLIIHVDPVGNENEMELEFIKILEEIMSKKAEIYTFHDLRAIDKEMEVDLVVNGRAVVSYEDDSKMKAEIVELLKKKKPEFNYTINLDKRYKERT